MHRTSTRLTCFAMTLLAATAAGAAQDGRSGDDDDGDEAKSYSWGLGIGGMSQQQPYTDIDRDNMVLPLIYFENRWVELLGPNLNFKLPELEWGEDQELEFAVGIEFDFNGYEAKDAPILNGMAERKEGLLAGVSTEWSNPFVNVSAAWMVDVSGEHDGQRASFGLERSFQLGERFMVTPGAAATYMDKKYANYYYGVRSVEARAGRPAYLVDSTVNAEFSLRTDYMINPRQMLFVELEYTALGSEIKDSPLVDDSGETEIFLGYLYRF
jgi:MipA family protein